MRALVDTGSTYTWVARDVLEALGVAPQQVNERLMLVPGRAKASRLSAA
ncbi:MAG: aspartyl protease family protein [Gemmatimonadales bacterium]